MKHPISILQSRIAKRSRRIRKYTSPYRTYKFGVEKLNPPMYNHSHPVIVHLAQEQKEDKKILAEIVQLRRQLKECDVILDRFYKAESTEMDNKILEARWGA